MNDIAFRNRQEAGQLLAKKLEVFADSPDTIILALPRGGAPVALEAARALNLPMDVLVVRKLGLPGYEELALGAIASGGAIVLNKELVQQLKIGDELIEQVAAREERELERRESAFRADKPFPCIQNRNVILIDDGIATGSTMRAAIRAVRQHGAKFVVVATPVAPMSVAREMQREADEFVAVATPQHFGAVGEWYWDFSQTTDEEVRACLLAAAHLGMEAHI